MKNTYRFLCVGLLLLLMSPLYGQNLIPTAKYVPPDLATEGEEAYHKDLAIVETSCSTFEEARALWYELTNQGALVSIITSPQRMMAWVPPTAYNSVINAKLQTATGTIGVVSVSYTAQEFRAKQKGTQTIQSATFEADEALVAYLEFIRRPKTAEEIKRMEEREMEIQFLQTMMPPQDCVKMNVVPANEEPPRKYEDNFMGGPGDEITRATKVEGLIVHTSFFLESRTGTGSWNWDAVVYDRYRNFYAAGMNYWTSFAAKYGRTATGIWRLYSPYNTYSQVDGEPTVIGENSFIPTVIDRLSSGSPPSWSNIGIGTRWVWMYNNEMRSSYSANEAICGFIGYKPSGDESIWPHASMLIWNNGDIEGVYFALDTQYWQAGHDPFSASRRNVIAHEIGHLWGCPDEYASDPGCFNWTYRGIGNINCQRNQPARGRPGLTMTGYDGIMGWNYIYGNSVATPVHTGIRSASAASPIRCFMTSPLNIPITVLNCDGGPRTYNTTMCLPLDFDYCMSVRVPLTRTIGATTYYFDYWEVKRSSGATSTYTYYGNEIPSYAWTSTLSNPVVDVKAVFTSTPPDFMTQNTTLTAWLAPTNNTASPGRAIALRWRSKYDMTRVDTKVEYEVSAGNWIEVPASAMTLAPFRVAINQWTGAHLISVPTAGGGTVPIAANQQYNFRIVGYYNTLRGTPSVTASVRTRPASPVDTTFCYDAYEPNSISTPRVLTSSGSGMDPYTIKAACPITSVTGEFSWYHPKKDYYRITVIDLSSSLFGEGLNLTLRVREGSDFKPKFRAQRVGTTTYINAISLGSDMYRLRLSTDGEYVLLIEPEINVFISNDFVDRFLGHFGFGEYTLTAERTISTPPLYRVCLDCVKLQIVRPFPGILVMEPPFDLLGIGIKPTGPLDVPIRYMPPPGFSADGYDGDFGRKTDNPTNLHIDPTTKPGEYDFYPIARRIATNLAELVVINPEGPGGPPEYRVTRAIGTVENATVTAPTGYVFVGWGGDTIATTNPLPVTLWKSKKLIAYFREKPCVPEPMIEWHHAINFVNSKQGSVKLEYGMEPGAGDGLEAGQVDLPPFPPGNTFDIRWINIPGSQGSTTDIRAIKESHVYQGRVQTGAGTTPVVMSWGSPATTPNASYTLRIQGVATPINMRSVSSYTFSDEGIYMFTVEVKAPTCPPPSNPPEVDITTVRVDPRGFPCIDIELLIKDKKTGNILPFYNPYKIKIYEKDQSGNDTPANLTHIIQKDTTLLLRLCSHREDNDPNRRVTIITDNDDPDTEKDTTNLYIPIPVPTGQGNLVRFLRQNSGDWEMVSLPVEMDDSLASSLYADPTTRLFEFNTATGLYEGASTMIFGTGYWLKTNDKSTLFVGFERNSYQWTGLNGVGEPYGYGWNMIGALSKSLPVSQIQVTPSGGLRSIFGWNPTSGYVIPTTVDPGMGYWVRVNPGTTLKMEVSGFTNDGCPVSAYQKVADRIQLAGQLMLRTSREEIQSILISAEPINTGDIDLLQLPELPPDGLFDIRTGDGTRFAVPGENFIRIQAMGEMTLTLLPFDGSIRACALYSEDGELLHDFDVNNGGTATIQIKGGATALILKVQTRAVFTRTIELQQNYPNPFSAITGTAIPYELDSDTYAQVSIYDLLGRKVRTLVYSEVKAGGHVAFWDGRSEAGNPVPSGLYIYRLEAGGRVFSKILSVVK